MLFISYAGKIARTEELNKKKAGYAEYQKEDEKYKYRLTSLAIITDMHYELRFKVLRIDCFCLGLSFDAKNSGNNCFPVKRLLS